MDAAMNSAVSGLQAQSTALSNISNNLANSQTTGYKAIETQFTSLLTEMTTGATFTTGGVAASARQNLLQNGTITGTNTSTDMAINGAGMFAVTFGTGGGTTYYTRNGAFDSDQNGNLYLSGTNYYLQGWPTDTNGKVQAGVNSDNAASLETVNIDKYNSSAVATTNYSMQANFPAAAQDKLASLSYSNTSGATENVTMSYSLVGTTAATTAPAPGTDSYSTYLVTVSAPPGQTITDGMATPNTGNQITYQVSVGGAGSSNGTIFDIQAVETTGAGGATVLPTTAVTAPATGTASAAVTFPSITPSDASAAVTYPTTWSASATNPTWGELQSAMSNNFSKPTSMTVYDSLGVEQSFPVTWTATGDNTWLMTVNAPTDAAGTKTTGQLVDDAGNVVNSYSYQVTFNTDGTYQGITALPSSVGGKAPMTNTGEPQLSATWTDGAAASTGSAAVSVNLGTGGQTDGLSQFATTTSTSLTIAVKSTKQDGVQYGQLTGISVDTGGDIIAAYDNGQKVPIYKIPVVTFPNENGLTQQNDGVYAQSALSGNYTLNEAGTNGSGSISGQALEGSTVNTSVEFSNMITAQQAYSSASQVISTDKQMFQSLMQAVAG